MELIGFFQRAFPQSASVKSSEKRQTDESEPLIVEVRMCAGVLWALVIVIMGRDCRLLSLFCLSTSV